MSKPTNLDSQTRYLWVIFGRKNSPLTDDFKVYYERLKAWCDINAQLYAFIGHDKDIDDDGQPKFRHIHALIVLKEGVKPRLSTSLNNLSKATQIDAVDIDIEIADSVTQCIRYCIHKGYPQKYQYSISELVTNLAQKDLDEIMKDAIVITAGYLIELVQICNYSVVKILNEIGLSQYCRYRNVIKDIIVELNGY